MAWAEFNLQIFDSRYLRQTQSQSILSRAERIQKLASFKNTMLTKCLWKKIMSRLRPDGQKQQWLRRRRLVHHILASTTKPRTLLQSETHTRYRPWKIVSFCSAKPQSSLHWIWTVSSGKSRSKQKIDTARPLPIIMDFIASCACNLGSGMLRLCSSA